MNDAIFCGGVVRALLSDDGYWLSCLYRLGAEQDPRYRASRQAQNITLEICYFREIHYFLEDIRLVPS